MSRPININLYQGNILSPHVFAALKPDLKLPDTAHDEKILAVTISHSCDIASENEPKVEFILGTIIDEIDGNCTYAKNPRKLHIQLTFEGNPIVLELIANQKFEIEKETLQNHGSDNRYEINLEQTNILRDWLAARYKRQALPDELQYRINPVLACVLSRIMNSQ